MSASVSVMDDIIRKLEEVEGELKVITPKLVAIDLHLQMIDRNIERLVQLALRINGQLPEEEAKP